MSTKRTVLAGVLAITALSAAAIFVLERVTGEPTDPRPTHRAEAGQPASQPDLRLPPPAPLAPPPAAPPPPAAAPAPASPEAPPAPIHRDLLTSLEAARARILDCGGVDLPEPEGGGRARRQAAKQDAARPKTVLLLDLEPLEGQMAVRGLEVVSQGGQDGEDLVRCARQELAGRLLEAANAHPGRRLKMQFVVDRARR